MLPLGSSAACMSHMAIKSRKKAIPTGLFKVSCGQRRAKALGNDDGCHGEEHRHGQDRRMGRAGIIQHLTANMANAAIEHG